MTGFEPRPSSIESDRSTNWATTTAGVLSVLFIFITKYTLFKSFKRLEVLYRVATEQLALKD